MTPTITVELIGSCIAVHRESGISADLTSSRNRKSAIPVLCRMLLKAGYDPQARIHVIRKALSGDHMIPVFKRDRMLIVWAGVDIIDSVAKGPREVKHRPFPEKLGTGQVTVEPKNARGDAEASEAAADTAKRMKALHRDPGNDALILGEAA